MRDSRSSPGNQRHVPYSATALNVEKIAAYAKRVANQAADSTAEPDIVRPVSKTSTEAVTRKAGFLGLRRETVQVPRTTTVNETLLGRHWILHTTFHNIENRRGDLLTEYNEQRHWVLQADGKLFKVWRWEETKGLSTGVRVERDLVVEPMMEEDILALDYRYPSYDQSNSRPNAYWGNRMPGKLAVHAKGVGISLALKAVLEGRPPRI